MDIFINGFFILAVLALRFWADYNFKKLIDIEYQNHYEQWLRDGKPYVFFSQTPRSEYGWWGERWVSAPFWSHLYSLALLINVPDWVWSDSEAKKYLFHYRLGMFIFLGIFLFFCVIGILVFLSASLNVQLYSAFGPSISFDKLFQITTPYTDSVIYSYNRDIALLNQSAR